MSERPNTCPLAVCRDATGRFISAANKRVNLDDGNTNHQKSLHNLLLGLVIGLSVTLCLFIALLVYVIMQYRKRKLLGNDTEGNGGRTGVSMQTKVC
jgi:heme/copper-type cytochrome/quinol oxidase subunit 2